MKNLIIVFFLFGSLTAFAQNKIDGDWKGTRDTPNGPMEMTYTFKVDGDSLKGLLKTQFGEIPLEDGKANGKKFSYSISINDMTINSTGELIKDDEILIKNDRGEMKLTRVK